jgi:outer membrane protein OmpA-like peptidoglycan-associated protein
MIAGRRSILYSFTLSLCLNTWAADLPGSKDPAGVKRYTGSEIIGYREPRFDEFLLPLGPPTEVSPPSYAKSQKVDGLIGRYTYAAPAGRTPAEVFRNYQLEFQRLGLVTLYEKSAGQRGWFGPTLSKVEEEDQLGQILEYNEAQERVLIARTKEAKPAYYYVFVTAYKDGIIPERLAGTVTKDTALAQLIVIAPQALEQNMTLLNAEEMAKGINDTGKIALYGVHFDTDRDTIRPDSAPALKEIASLLSNNPTWKLHVVGHTDNQGKPDYNIDLSRRRAIAVMHELSGKYGIAAARLDAFGCGPYAPTASNEDDAGRAKNRRVELVRW